MFLVSSMASAATPAACLPTYGGDRAATQEVYHKAVEDLAQANQDLSKLEDELDVSASALAAAKDAVGGANGTENLNSATTKFNTVSGNVDEARSKVVCLQRQRDELLQEIAPVREITGSFSAAGSVDRTSRFGAKLDFASYSSATVQMEMGVHVDSLQFRERSGRRLQIGGLPRIYFGRPTLEGISTAFFLGGGFDVVPLDGRNTYAFDAQLGLRVRPALWQFVSDAKLFAEARVPFKETVVDSPPVSVLFGVEVSLGWGWSRKPKTQWDWIPSSP